MTALNFDVPVCGWIAIKTRSVQEMISLRHVVLSILRVTVIEIKDVDTMKVGTPNWHPRRVHHAHARLSRLALTSRQTRINSNAC